MAPIAALQERLQAAASPAKKAWWERYLKGTASFRGTPMGEVRKAVRGWYREGGLETLEVDAQADLALALLREPLTEDKLSGMLLVQELLLPAGRVQWASLLPAVARIFDEGHIADWNACDWLCVKVLGPLVEAFGEPCAREIVGWKEAPGLWRRRASGVAFVNLAPRGEANFPGFVEMVLESCAATVRDPSRFAQTGTGWVLRELGAGAPDRVRAFLEAHRNLMSREALSSAVRRLPEGEARDILAG